MELRNLITFINVAELGSFTKAAQLLGYSQSTISFQIKQLEDELGCLLFERINHTITLTERGRELVSYAHQIRTLTDEFKESFEEEKECNGHIHIVTPDSVCDEMIKKSYIISIPQFRLNSLPQILLSCLICLTITKRMLLLRSTAIHITRTMLSQRNSLFQCTLWQMQVQNLPERAICQFTIL